MANYCEVCGKGTQTGMNVSHSHLKTKRTWKPNIQRVRVVLNATERLHSVPSFRQSGTSLRQTKNRHRAVFLMPVFPRMIKTARRRFFI